MRILILSCNTGAGHNSCARAVRETVLERGDECDIEDALRFISNRASKVISGGHVGAYRHVPKLFGKGYSYAEHHRSLFEENTTLYNYFTKASDGIYQLVIEKNYDAVLCTHPFSALILTDILKHHKLNAVTAFLATDFTCSPTAEQSSLDLYFIPDASLTDEFVGFGIPRERIVPTGIPIRKMFFTHTDKSQAKQIFGIPENHRHLLMMCGSMGAGPMKKIAAALAEQLSPEQDLTVVCGTNKKMLRQLSEQYADTPNVHILGFVEDMSRLMDSADLYITKPGGISVTEANVKALPMVFIDAVAGCEEYNLRFYLSVGGAVTAKEIPELATLCADLLTNDERRMKMRAALKSLQSFDASVEIYDKISQKLQRKGTVSV